MASGSPFMDFVRPFKTRARRNERKAWRLQKKAAGDRVRLITDQLRTHDEETQRSGAALKQSLAGRGLSKSTIAKQDLDRHKRLSARRREAIDRSRIRAQEGLDLIKSRYEQWKNEAVARSLHALGGMISVVAGAAGGIPTGGGGGGGDLNPGAGSPSGGGHESMHLYGGHENVHLG